MNNSVIPTKVGIQVAGFIDSRLRGNDGRFRVFIGSVLDSNALIKKLKTSGNTVGLDASGEPLRKGVSAAPDIVKPNQKELETLVGEEASGFDQIVELGRRLLGMGPRQALITLGQKGAAALSDREVYEVTVPSIRVVDTVGCGDAVMAGVLVAKKRDLPFDETIKLAMACGLSNAAHKGAGEIDKEQVLQFNDQVGLSPPGIFTKF